MACFFDLEKPGWGDKPQKPFGDCQIRRVDGCSVAATVAATAAATAAEGPPRFMTWKLYGPRRQITAHGVVRVHAPLGE